jgi:glycosyltransferase involved in cell wall biosynthesis
VSEEAFISVIVACYNEEKYLELCLSSLSRQNYPRELYEIIVVDNGSTDCSVDIAKRSADIVEVRPKIKVGALRNIGVQLAKGSIIAFLDGDCEAKVGWLRTINNLSLTYPNTVHGAECYIDSSKPWIPRAWFCTNKVGRVETVSLGASNVTMPKQLFVDVGGFNENLTTGEDAELFCRLESMCSVVYDSSLEAVHHGVPLTLRSFFGREVWHGLGSLGSFKVQPFDKPLIATGLFFIGVMCSILGLFLLIFSGSYFVFLMGIAFSLFILMATILHRRRFIRSPLHALQLGFLFVLYYTARSISLIKLFFGFNQSYYRRDRD